MKSGSARSRPGRRIDTRPWFTSLSTRNVPGVSASRVSGPAAAASAPERPAREERVELRGHLGLPEVAGGRDNHVARGDPLRVERGEVGPREGLDRGLRLPAVSRRSPRRKEGRSGSRFSIEADEVVALLEAGEDLVPAEVQAVLLESGLRQDFAQDREAFVEGPSRGGSGRRCRGRRSSPRPARRRPAERPLGLSRAAEKREALLEVLGLALLRPAAGEQPARHLGEPLLAGRVQVRAALEEDLDVHERQVAVSRRGTR